MSRSKLATLALAIAFLSPATGAVAAELAPAPQGPILPLAEYARWLDDSDREKRLAAAEAIRDHYKGKALDALPQLLKALGEELDRPDVIIPLTPSEGRTLHLGQTLRQAAYGAGPGRLKVLRESTRHSDPQVRAAAYRAWLKPVNFEANIAEDRAELLAAIRHGLKDKSPLVRGQAASALRAFWDAPPKMAEEAVSLMAAALDDRAKPREGVRSPAVEAAGMLSWFGARAKPAIPSLAKAAATDDERLVRAACSTLNLIAKVDETVAEDVVKILRPLFTDKKRPDGLRLYAVSGLPSTSPAVRWVIQDLVDVLEEPGAPVGLRRTVISVLERSGPRAAPAVSALIDRLEKTTAELEQMAPLRQKPWLIQALGPCFRVYINFRGFVDWPLGAEQSTTLDALKAIGPAAAPAVERLEKWMEKQQDPMLRIRAHAALQVIKN
jgi:HEAT repeat protein